MQPVHAGQNVRAQGQDVQTGSQVLSAGLRLRPQDLGVIASVGLARVAVHRPLRVAVVSTGDELVEPGEQLHPGQIFNSNRFTLIGALQRLGQPVIDGGILPDDPEQTRGRLSALADQADVIISSGGAGNLPPAGSALSAHAAWLYHRRAVPFCFARRVCMATARQPR